MAKETATKLETSPKFIWTMRALAFILLVIAGYLLLKGDSAGGAVAGAIAFGLALFHYVPMVTEVSGFGLTAKLERKVMQAEEILEHIRSITSGYARSTYHQLAWMNRSGAPSDQSSRDLVNLMDRVMESIGVSTADRLEAKKPYLMMIGFDLLSAVLWLIRRYSFTELHELENQITERTGGKPIDTDDVVTKGLIERRHRIEFRDKLPHPEDYEKIENMSSYLSDIVERMGIVGEDKNKIQIEIDRASKLFSDCVEAGNKTVEAEHFISVGLGSENFERVFGRKGMP